MKKVFFSLLVLGLSLSLSTATVVNAASANKNSTMKSAMPTDEKKPAEDGGGDNRGSKQGGRGKGVEGPSGTKQ